MNRRRNESRTPATIFFALILAATIAAAGGVLHAFYKNRQVQVSREIDAIDGRVEQCRLDIRTTEMRMDLLLNRFAIRKQIEENGTSLRPMYSTAGPRALVEEIDAATLTRHSVASAVP
ncbi:MAG: hypothetical protein ABIS50_16910 [Luteolibacter sp.]|uniref:hypothetical protein n=1 Tax=Luteolibacter sp. TaxID=1962973 RepID=UPI0032664EB0